MLEINNITKVFNRDLNPEDMRIALDDVTLHVKEGEFVTVIGGNGSGKSTLLNVITGSVLPDSGSIAIGGNNITSLKEYRRAQYIGIVFQDPLSGTAANMSLEENLLLAYRRPLKKGLMWAFNKQLKAEFMEKLASLGLGLEGRLNQKIGYFSGGQRQAVTLLMATLNPPKLLLLDEHTAALDPKTAATVLGITDNLVRSMGLTTIMVTHNMRDALRYGDRILMLNNGKIIFDASGEEKKNLTTADLLKKFGAMEDVELTDTMLLSN